MVTAVVPVSDNALAAADADRLGARLAAMPTRTLVLGALGVVLLVATLLLYSVYARLSSDEPGRR